MKVFLGRSQDSVSRKTLFAPYLLKINGDITFGL